MLDEPQNINDADSESITAITNAYPYFVPARYMLAAQKHKTDPYNPEIMARMQLYSGNWYQYCEYLQNTLNGEVLEYQPANEQAAKQPVIIPATAEDELQALEQGKESLVTDTQLETQSISVTEQTIEDDPEIDFGHVNTGFIRGRNFSTPPPIKDELLQPTTEPTPKKAINADFKHRPEWEHKSDNLIPPIYTEDYFLHQGMTVSNEIPEDIGRSDHSHQAAESAKSLMVMMSFSEWLSYYKRKRQEEQEEEQDQKELKTMWQKEKLAAALEEENEEIPEGVFEMAVNSITKEENLVSESLAEVLVKQGRYDKAIDMYKKLSLRKPQKKAYFARKIEEILKEK